MSDRSLHAFHSTLKPGAVEGYLAAHRRIPDDLVTVFLRAGIRDWTIWRSGRRLFHLVDCDDLAGALARIAADPADERWQEEIGQYVEAFRSGDGDADFDELPRVWSLTGQTGTAP